MRAESGERVDGWAIVGTEPGGRGDVLVPFGTVFNLAFGGGSATQLRTCHSTSPASFSVPSRTRLPCVS